MDGESYTMRMDRVTRACPGLFLVGLLVGCGSASPVVEPSPDAAVVVVLPACASNPAYEPQPDVGRRYRAVAGLISWTDARAACLADEADLVVINGPEENTYVFSLLQRDTWIGLMRVGPGDAFEWVDGQPVSYDNWAFPEPNDVGGDEDYGEFADAGEWADVADSDPNNGYICECDTSP